MPRRKKERRSQGEGSVYKRKDKAGKVVGYRGELFLGNDAAGAPQRWRCSAKTEALVIDLMTKARADLLGGQLVVGPKQTVGEYLEWWLADVAPQSLRARTLADYQSIVAQHLRPTLGALPLAKLTPPQITHLLAQKRQAGLSPRRVQYIRAVLHKAFADAVRQQILDRNPVDAVPSPKVETNEHPTLDLEQLQTFLQVVAGDALEALYVLAVTTGMRQGELLALRWSDYDRPKRTLHVRRALSRFNGQVTFDLPKSRASRRPILLTAIAVDALARHRRGRDVAPEALIFARADGAPLKGSWVTASHFQPLLKRAGLPRVRFHDLRHSLASLLVGGDTHPKQVQGLLGHSTVQITLDLYTHLSTRLQRELVQHIEGLLLGGALPPIPPQSVGELTEDYVDGGQVGDEGPV
ncbi:MAG: tyrosine-type recombinase/integrase [Chloroflexota bacterium]